jgi:hypothetical protein
MLKFFLQTGLIAALLGALGISINAETLNDAQAMLHKLSGMARGAGLPGSEPAAIATDHAAAVVRTMTNGAGEQSAPPPGGIAGRAFDNKVPQDCFGEKIIEIEGKVRCAHARRSAAP